MAEAIVRRQPDVLLAIAGAAIEAARSATTTIPLVALGAESTLRGPSVNLARPVGNVTGVVILGAELDMKRLEFLNSTLPGEGPIGVLLVPTNPYVDGRRVALAEAARAVGAQLQIVEAAMPAAYAAAFEAFRTARVRAVLVGSDPQYVRDAPTLARLAQASQLPTMCHWREMTIDGCLMSYGGNLKILWQRLGEQVARVLEKNPVSGIPIEAPMQLELVVNLRTAKTLGLNLPRDLLLRADEVIE
jgi:putative ABC transport system substrate-binding protein